MDLHSDGYLEVNSSYTEPILLNYTEAILHQYHTCIVDYERHSSSTPTLLGVTVIGAS